MVRLRGEILGGIGAEFRGASLAAEVISLPLVGRPCRPRISGFTCIPQTGSLNVTSWAAGLPDLHQIGSSGAQRYFAGSARNFVAQPLQQK